MNLKLVAGWLREAAASINYWSDGEGDRFRKYAAQVEAMTCGSCRWFAEDHWHSDYGKKVNICENQACPIIANQSPKFGCIHWEVKNHD